MQFRYLSVIIIIFFLTSLAACDKFEGSQTIPAYIRIDSLALHVSSPAQGSASSRITDAWVYIDEQLIGAFELPAMVPVLAEGSRRLRIRPGIRLDGMVEIRTFYPLYNDISSTITLVPDSVVDAQKPLNGKVTLKTTYRDAVQFVWAENFEDNVFALDTTRKSSSAFELTTTGDPTTFEGLHSGRIRLTAEKNLFEAASTEAIFLPAKGSPVFLEMNYRCTNTLTIGVFGITSNEVIQSPIINLSPTASWNKIYINLTPNVSSATAVTKYKIFVAALLDEGLEESEILIDNLKLVYINNAN
jgi:hypothetical protein